MRLRVMPTGTFRVMLISRPVGRNWSWRRGRKIAVEPDTDRGMRDPGTPGMIKERTGALCGRRLRGVSDGELAHEASSRILLRLLIQRHPAVAAKLLPAGRPGGAGSPPL
jgi:hypothetical protein